MPSASKKQRNLMAAAAHNPTFAKKAGVPVKVAKEFNRADKGQKFYKGDEMAQRKVKKMAFGGPAGGPPNLPQEGRARDLGLTRPEGAPAQGVPNQAMIDMAKRREVPAGATMLQRPAGGPPNLPQEGRARDLGLTRPEGAPAQGAVNQDMLAAAMRREVPAGARQLQRPAAPAGMKKGGKVSSASKRADGCAQRGKTKGRMV